VSKIGTILSKECTDNQSVQIGGIVTAAKRIPTKNGETMCFINLEDFTGTVEVIVFPRTFERTGPLLVPDLPVLIGGRVSITDDKIKVIAETVSPLGQQRVKEVRLRIRKEQETPDVFEQLKQTFTLCKGETTVYLQLVDQGRTIKTEKQFWVQPSAATIKKLETILGPGSVSLA